MVQINTYPLKGSAILRIYFDKELIDVDPEYQRNGDIWNLEKRQLLIDSILNEYDIPKIYFHDLSKPKKLLDGREVIFSIIDGRQRIETIWNFISGKFPLSNDFKFLADESINAGGMTYTDLSKRYPKLKVIFDSFVLPIVCVKTDDIELNEDMFSRLNEAVPLNSAEKRNAFGGPIARMINDISSHHFFENRVKFNNKRYQYKEMAAKLLFLEDSILRSSKIYDTKKEYLDEFVKLYKADPSLNTNQLGDKVKTVLNEMANVFTQEDSLLSTQTIVPIYYLLFWQALKQGMIQKITRDKLLEFKEKVKKNREIAEQAMSKADYDLLEFSRLSIQGTNDAGSIKERVRIICHFFNLNESIIS